MADHTNTSKDRTPQELSRTKETGKGELSKEDAHIEERMQFLRDRIGFVLTPISDVDKPTLEEKDIKNERLILLF